MATEAPSPEQLAGVDSLWGTVQAEIGAMVAAEPEAGGLLRESLGLRGWLAVHALASVGRHGGAVELDRENVGSPPLRQVPGLAQRPTPPFARLPLPAVRAVVQTRG